MRSGNRHWVVYVGAYPRPQIIGLDDHGQPWPVVWDEFEAEMLVVQNVFFPDRFIANCADKRKYRQIKSADDRILKKELKLAKMRLTAEQERAKAFKGIPALDLGVCC